MKKLDYYVYILSDPLAPAKIDLGSICLLYLPFYVGKGRKDRAHSHIREATSWNKKINHFKCGKINKIISRGEMPIITYLVMNLGEEAALSIEESVIAKLGLLIDDSGCLTNIRKTNWTTGSYISRSPRKGNGHEGKNFRRKTVLIGDEMMQLDSRFFGNVSYIDRYKKQDISKNTSKQRFGSTNGKFGKEALSKGKRWITIDNKSMLLSPSEIEELDCDFEYGRYLDSHKNRIRIIFENEHYAKYVNKDLSDVPDKVKFQYGLLWKKTKPTYIKENNNVIISENKG